jgi:hypothetical protein
MQKKFTLTTFILFFLLMVKSLTASAQVVLVITNPPAVCAPVTVSLTSSAITAGSTLPAGTTLAYFTNAAATTVLATPSAVSITGTYYIKATNGALSDIKPVIVTIVPLPTFTITSINPAACGTTSGSITLNGLLSGVTYIVNYKKNGIAQTPLTSTATATGKITITGLNANPYSGITITPSGGCMSIAQSVTLSDPITFVPVASNNGPLNVGGTLNLSTTTTSGATYSWSGPNSFNSLSATTSITNVTAANAGDYTMTTTALGCTGISTTTVIINSPPVLTITNPVPACSVVSVDITAPQITAGSILPPGTILSYFTDVATTTSLVNPSAINTSGTYYIKATNSSLSDVKPVIVSILPTPVLVIRNPNAVCAPYTIDLTSPSVAIGNSSLPANTVLSYYTDFSCTSPLIAPEAIATTNIYYIKATTPAGCYDIAAVSVTINPTPVAPIVSDLTYCQGTIAAALVATTIPGSSLLWYSAPVNGIGTTTAPVPATTISGETTYYASQATPNGCESVRSALTVTTSPIPTLTINNPAPACIPSTVDITTQAVTGNILSGATLNYYTDASITNPLANPTAIATSGIYYIQAFTPAGCTSIDSVVVSISTSCKAAEPVSVYPNPASENLNLSFNPDETGAGYFELINEKGQTVIKEAIVYSPLIAINIANLPEGKYYYVIRKSNGQKFKIGKVMIIR